LLLLDVAALLADLDATPDAIRLRFRFDDDVLVGFSSSLFCPLRVDEDDEEDEDEDEDEDEEDEDEEDEEGARAARTIFRFTDFDAGFASKEELRGSTPTRVR
jgi:hypothetical protein